MEELNQNGRFWLSNLSINKTEFILATVCLLRGSMTITHCVCDIQKIEYRAVTKFLAPREIHDHLHTLLRRTLQWKINRNGLDILSIWKTKDNQWFSAGIETIKHRYEECVCVRRDCFEKEKILLREITYLSISEPTTLPYWPQLFSNNFEKCRNQ